MTSHRLAWLFFGCSVFACGDDAPIDDDTGSSSSPTETGTSGSSDETSAPESSSSASVSVGESSSGAPTTSADTSTDGGSSSAGSSSSGSTDTTGGGVCEPLSHPSEWPCGDDGDCEIAGDCCGCIAYNPNLGAPGNCGGGCEQDVCEQLGLDSAVCVDNTCQVVGFSCDQSAVMCDSLPPECDDGMLPQVADGCWTDACLPVEFCDWVPDCDTCPDSQICVVVQTDGCDQHDCVDPIPECGGGDACECLGNEVCPPPYTTCAVEDGAIVCS
jgi:hypothetical protein